MPTCRLNDLGCAIFENTWGASGAKHPDEVALTRVAGMFFHAVKLESGGKAAADLPR
jgi:hypothetical protein